MKDFKTRPKPMIYSFAGPASRFKRVDSTIQFDGMTCTAPVSGVVIPTPQWRIDWATQA